MNRLTPTPTRPDWSRAVLCSNMLGGAEIFTLERMLAGSDAAVLHCNATLASQVRQDARYDRIDVVAHPSLDALATRISWRNLVAASALLEPLLRDGGWLLGNLRASAVQLVSRWSARNAIFVHDNTHYLNARARWTIALSALRSQTTFFPCRHATQRLPLRRVLAPRLQTVYFAPYTAVQPRRRPADSVLRIVKVGRVEPDKNQALALAIAARLAGSFVRVELTLLGPVTVDAYARSLRDAERPHNLSVLFRQVPRSGVPALLRTQDLLLHTSLKESLPLVLFEAAAAGLPCFAVEAGGIGELLPPDFLLAPQPDPAAGRILAQVLATDPGQIGRPAEPTELTELSTRTLA
jgi:glycosyltransferase involved in cell wall biosynthesis